MSLRGKKILFVDSTLVRSGAENLRLFACRNLAADNQLHDLVLGEPGDVAEDLEKENLAQVHRAGTGDALGNTKATLAVWRAVSQIQPDLVVAARFNAAWHAAWATGGRYGLVKKAPLVIEVMSTDDWMRPAHKAIWRGLLWNAHLVTGCARTVSEHLHQNFGVPQKRLDTVVCGADLDGLTRLDKISARQQLGLPLGPKIVGSVGTLRTPKRYDRLLDAGAQLLARGHDIHLLLSGHGPEKNNLEAQAQKLGIREKVTFAPRLPNVGVQYSALDVFVLPSDFEGLPLVVPEAMSMGIPVIASQVSGVPDIVQPERTGWLFLPQNLTQLVGHLENVLAGGAAIQKITAYAQTYANSYYTAARYGQDAAAAYQKALSPATV